jgi:hypothetical protein
MQIQLPVQLLTQEQFIMVHHLFLQEVLITVMGVQLPITKRLRTFL